MTTMTEAPVREFKMPDVGEGLTEAEILKWYVQPGDTVTDGQVVCEVGVAPVKPAEFVIFRIGQWTADAQQS